MRERITQKLVCILGVLALFSLTGCAIKQMELTESGFLSGYSGLEEDKKLGRMHIYKNPDVMIAQRYSKIIIAPIEFKLDPTVKEHEMKDENKIKLSDYFHKKLFSQLF